MFVAATFFLKEPDSILRCLVAGLTEAGGRMWLSVGVGGSGQPVSEDENVMLYLLSLYLIGFENNLNTTLLSFLNAGEVGVQ